MKKYPRKTVLLFAAAMAVCAFATPSMASASSWGTVGTHHTLTSTNLGFLYDAILGSSMCTSSSSTARVVSAATMEIDSASFTGCTFVSVGLQTTCTMTWVGTSFPWTATAVSTSNIQIHGVDINVFYENHPGGGGGGCGVFTGQTFRITGTLTGARWTGNGAGQHSVEFLGAAGLVSHVPATLGGGVQAITPSGTLGNTSLTVTN